MKKFCAQADKLVLPGVGAFAACMQGLRAHGFDELVIEEAHAGKPTARRLRRLADDV